MQLARKMAETVSHVRDHFMLGEVINKVSARIGIAVSDFKALLSKLAREHVSVEMSRSPGSAVAPPHDIALLCLLALRSEEAHQFLRAQNWREILPQLPGTELLALILESEMRPDDAASLNAFMATLSSEEERLVSSWLLRKTPPDAPAGPWLRLRQAVMRRQLQIAEARMKLPNQSTGEITALQKQTVDLQEQLRELSKFSSARMLDT